MNFKTKDSGKTEEFKSGYHRDTQEGKIRYDLIPPEALKRVGELYGRGAKLYGDDNWKKGAPFKRIYASIFRHLMAWRMGEDDEDHLAAVIWNTMALIYYQEMQLIGELPFSLDDRD